MTSERRSVTHPTTSGTTTHSVVVAPSWAHSCTEEIRPSNRATWVSFQSTQGWRSVNPSFTWASSTRMPDSTKDSTK